MNWRRWVFSLVIALLAFPLVLHGLAGTRRSLELETFGAHEGVRLFRDLGRGDYPPDALELPGGERFLVPIGLEVRSVRVELLHAGADAAVLSSRLDGVPVELSKPLPSPPPPPLATLALSAVLAVLLGAFTGSWLLRRAPTSVEQLFTGEGAAFAAAGWLLVILSLERTAQFVDAWVKRFDNPPWWPVSIVDVVTPTFPAVLAGAALVSVVAWASGKLQARPVVLAALLALASLGGNTLHGWQQGLVRPVSGPHSYWLDVDPEQPALDFLAHFNERQRALHTHSRTHPPLAVLLYAPFVHLGAPALAALCLGALAFGVSLLSLWRLQRLALPLFAALPAVQLYFLASLDAVICAVFLATLALAFGAPPGRRWLACVPLFVATQLTFASLFLVALLLWEVVSARSRELLGALALTAVGVALLKPAVGFDWLEAFRVASALENPGGFRLLSEPLNYLFTRLEGVTELVLFLGPWVSALLLLSPRTGWASRGLVVLLAMFLAGAFKTGETARACLFVLPCVVALVAPKLTPRRVRVLVVACFAQATVMQLWGDFFW